jgi:hypothetical protein
MQTDKKIEYKGYLIEKYTWGRRQYDIFYLKMELIFQDLNYYLI